jgi:beta-glucosidase
VMGVYQPYGAAAGLDVENPEPRVWGDALVKAVDSGGIEPEVIDRACRRILTTLYYFAAAEDPLPEYGPGLVASDAHRALALEAAEKSAVLLANDGVLPLSKGIGSLAVLGRLAAIENTGDNGSSRVRPPYVVTALEGLQRAQNAYGIGRIVTGDESNLAAASAAAVSADAVVVVVGNTAEDEGEFIPGDLTLGQDSSQERRAFGGDRIDLRLRDDQVALIRAAKASGKPVIVVIVAGSAIIVEEWHDDANAILQTFYAGMEGGTALARLLFGDVSPSGKLPFTVAKRLDDYSFFDRDAASITYDLWHGYSKLDRDGITPRYAFGHGLSYAQFTYRALQARVANDTIETSVGVTNTGACSADEVVQLYIGTPGAALERQTKLLKAFTRVTLNPGETRIVRLSAPLDDLRWRDAVTHDWKLEPGTYRVMAGGASDALIETKVQV